MRQPYEITLKDGVLPSVTINAPALTVRPHAWRTRLAWAWRCLRGQTLDLNPVVNLVECQIESSNPYRAGVEIRDGQEDLLEISDNVFGGP